ncbi:Methyltransferase domain,S-adenosyl-L-methionine-dependent methyltransferase [Cinara cedri]|uniref:Methyltransferase domain,S-adenosyl-L-methionine-dependent methyltransferase n=1 Tax=Cinara cedri TaxID=506608 RepID=A0A5E4NDZ3_9HEMI|nr:Methyltransferase domain,S-adenosyl-L-methionine-dependent methyltransferase [Cinara cedri]
MNLVPEKNSEFSTTEYWDSFFTKRKATFEWYGNYENLKRLLMKYVSAKDVILMSGCGNSNLSLHLYSDGFTNITNIDNSEVVIANMNKKHKDKYPGLVYEIKDILNTEYQNEKFSVVIDKGTLDALMPDSEVESLTRAMAMFNEIKRILKFGGRYICVSLLQYHIAKFIFSYFSENNWIIRVCQCTEVEDSADFNGQPVFMVICTKVNKIPGAKSVLEWNSDGITNERLDLINELLEIVIDTQKSVSMCFDLTKCQMKDMSNSYRFEINCSQTKKPRYTIMIVESPTQKNPKKMTFSGFIVPRGREHEWLFTSEEGQDILRRNCNVDRLAIISMHRGQIYRSLKQVQQELSRLMLKIAPQGVIQRGDIIQFLSLEQQLGDRKIIMESKSEHSGNFVIEEVTGEKDGIFRRLVFLNMPHIIQSEAKLIQTESGETKIDYSHFLSDYIPYLGLGVGIIANQTNKEPRILLIGLGGGILTNLLINTYRKINIIALEIDLVVYNIAKEAFGLIEDSRLEVHICDGLEYLCNAIKNGDSYDAVVYDIDVKDPSLGLSGPPKAFLTQDILNIVKSLIGEQGLFLLNFVCRASDVRAEIVNVLKTNFKQLTSLKVAEDINRVLLAKNSNGAIDEHLLKQTALYMNKCAKSNPLIACDVIDVSTIKDNIEDL